VSDGVCRHRFDDWSCFDELAEVINKRLLRLRTVELHVKPEQKHTWTEKLRKSIRVIIREEDMESVLGRSKIG
jgi:hypothetical protein